jgi:leucyl aminopeptidase
MTTTRKVSADPVAAAADLLVVAVGTPPVPAGPAADADGPLDGLLAACIADGEVTGTAGAVTVLHSGGRLPAPRVAVVGVGDGTPEDWREAGRAAGARARELKARSVALAPGDADAGRVAALVDGVWRGAYRFDRFRGGDPAPRVETLTVHSAALTPAGVRRADRLARAVRGARELVDTPANHLTPSGLAAYARDLADGVPGLECRVLEADELDGLGAGALLGVARGSAEPPAMITLRYTPARTRRRGEVLGLVGKAVTFDTGGISIKPSQGMEEMKMDMGGGAAVVEAVAAIAELGVPLEVVGVVPATENMPGGRAVKPGDVLRAMNGTTIEVVNTDAEGRLILADALCYATEHAGATHLVDFATLTGAIVVALGEVYAGLFGGDPEWTERVRRAGEEAGDLCWPMPMHARYRPLIESRVADLSNSSNKRQAGAVYAAQFLREFTGGRPWAHVDIAGTGMVGGAGTGFGVGLSLRLAEAMAGGRPARAAG